MANNGHLYSGSSDGSIKVWDIINFRRGCLKTVIAHKDCVSDTVCVCVKERERVMLCVCMYNEVCECVYPISVTC